MLVVDRSGRPVHRLATLLAQSAAAWSSGHRGIPTINVTGFLLNTVVPSLRLGILVVFVFFDSPRISGEHGELEPAAGILQLSLPVSRSSIRSIALGRPTPRWRTDARQGRSSSGDERIAGSPRLRCLRHHVHAASGLTRCLRRPLPLRFFRVLLRPLTLRRSPARSTTNRAISTGLDSSPSAAWLPLLPIRTKQQTVGLPRFSV